MTSQAGSVPSTANAGGKEVNVGPFRRKGGALGWGESVEHGRQYMDHEQLLMRFTSSDSTR